MKNVAVYYRVSREKQDIGMQRNEFEAWLKTRPGSPPAVTEYVDHGYSGKNADRPAFQSLLKDAFDLKFDTIIVYDLSRFMRNAGECIKTAIELDDIGVKLFSIKQPWLNQEGPFRRTLLTMAAEVAQIERQMIVERVKDSLKYAREVRKIKLGRPAVKPETVAEVKKARRSGLTMRKIALITGISAATVYKILKHA